MGLLLRGLLMWVSKVSVGCWEPEDGRTDMDSCELPSQGR